MSYCRFSSDNWKSDLYCYQSEEGFITHVATNRVIGEIPIVPDFLDVDNDTWLKAHNTQMEFLENAKRKKIGLRYDGKTFVDQSLTEFLQRLKLLKAEGYSVPDYLFKYIEQEILDEK